ncbi:MAG: pantoate--beta-alanine ligase [Rhodospirillales bacterium]|jgi:pantoate--beta-alanine ligase|nr:pantoate--beta-alanine ligase [Rhodospirillales bacterium]
MIETVRNVEDLREQVREWRVQGLNVGLVPTMGALHAGHMALAERSIATTDRTIATLFVNPKQFGEGEDLDGYPRDEVRDREKLAQAGVHFLFAPDVAQMYPSNFSTGVKVGGLGDILEGKFRPGFFDGVATVVSKLLNQTGAGKAFFGEKDYQQLQVITRMTRDLNIPTIIEGVPTIREEDGLALSSRNVYLNSQERTAAPILFKTISEVASKVKAGDNISELEAWGREQVLAAGFSNVDYLSVLDAQTLEAYLGPVRPGRVLVAAKLGRARLIDNVAV